jgi:hypothetical protein
MISVFVSMILMVVVGFAAFVSGYTCGYMVRYYRMLAMGYNTQGIKHE